MINNQGINSVGQNTIKLVDAVKWMEKNKGIEFWVKFLKADKSIRTMHAMTGFNDGTLSLNISDAKKSEDVVKVFDIDKKEYRSFRKGALLSFRTLGGQWQDIQEHTVVGFGS